MIAADVLVVRPPSWTKGVCIGQQTRRVCGARNPDG